MSNLITITSVPAEKLEAGQQQIIARWKSTEKRIIPAANRQRAVILPDTLWKAALPVSDSKSLLLFMHDAIEELARKYLSSICEDSNWQRTTVNEDAFTLASLLTWNEEQAAIAGRLNGDTIAEWVKESVTVKAVSEQHGADMAKALGEQFVKLAGPNHGLTPERAGKLLETIWKTDDADSNTGLRVMLRLQSIRDAAKKQEANKLADLF